MTLAIEPMITMGGWLVEFLDDGWTVVTRDGSLPPIMRIQFDNGRRAGDLTIC